MTVLFPIPDYGCEDLVVSFPILIADLGGGDGAVIETIIEDVFRERTVYVLYVL